MMKRLLILCVLALLTVPCMAASKASDELTFSASLFNPNDGETVWSASGEYLVGIGKNFLLGPSISLFDLGEVDGNSAGVAGEFGFPVSGLFVGGAVHVLGGDAAEQADYTGEARLGVKFGGPRGFFKLYASQVWSKAEDGAVVDPDGTSLNAGLGLRF